MVSIPMGLGDWESPSENISRLRLRNMYIAENPNSPDGMSRITRPSLDAFTTVGAGPISSIWRQDGTFNGDWLVVSGGQLFRVNAAGTATLVDPLPGTGYCQFAGTADRVLIVRDGTPYSTDGVDVSVVVMPDDIPEYDGIAAPISSIACLNSTFILSVKNTQRFYWINPGETDPDPLDFASAERSPDPIVSVNVLTDELWFIGTSGPEVWQPSNDPSIPFVRISGRVYAEGCASRDTVCTSVFNNNPCLIWVTDSRSVVLAQGSPVKISNDSVEESLRKATDLRAWTFRHNRHDFYVLTSNEFTLVFDLDRKEWVRWDSYGTNSWLAHLGSQSGSSVFAASSVGNVIWRLGTAPSDGDLPIIRELSGVVHNPGKSLLCSGVSFRVNAGWSPSYGATPTLELRWSDDQGVTWSEYVEVSLGDKGRYNEDVVFRSLGLITRPSRNFEVRFSAKASFRMDAAYMNEV